jgi:peptidoglycan/LPS O-acetylase OafA/YrhL
MVYLVLFMGLGLIMSVLGVNPLSGNGLMPKALLLFVSLALVMALANTLTDLFREQRRNWLRLARRRPIAGQKPDE